MVKERSRRAPGAVRLYRQHSNSALQATREDLLLQTLLDDKTQSSRELSPLERSLQAVLLQEETSPAVLASKFKEYYGSTLETLEKHRKGSSKVIAPALPHLPLLHP